MNSSLIPQAIQAALDHHQAGRLPQAEAILQQILQVEPNHPDALHFLGIIALQGGKKSVSVELISKAISINPTSLMYYNLGLVLRAQGKLDAAAESYQQALRIKPDYAEAYNNLGNLFKDQSRLDEAIQHYHKALLTKPDDAVTYNNLGAALRDQNRIEEAVTCYQQALRIRPDYAEAHFNMGNLLKDQGRLDEAIQHYHKALLIKPDDAVAYNNLGAALRDQNRIEEAVTCYQQALRIKPDYAEAHYNMGHLLKDQGRLDEALASYRLATLNSKRSWKESLHRLTAPLVVTTGMVLDSQKATIPEKSCTQATGLREQTAPPTKPVVPLAALQELHLREPAHSEPGARKNLRIMLIYPPPWQIASSGEVLLGMPFGAPRDESDREVNEDFKIITYGLLTIAAQAKRAGYDVSVYNLSACPWQEVVALIAETQADVYGISAFTANRRGMGAVAELIRQQHPQAHIMVGGPFVTALPQDTLRYYRDIDTAVIGEGEDTFMELLERLSHGRPTAGVPGTAWRNGEEIVMGPACQRIKNLDVLASPFDYFTSYIVMTSRGCPSKCTFCGSFTTWGKMLRFQSEESCIDTFRKALARLPVPFLAIKDDTFTAHRRRTIAICDSIIQNKMNFMWSCDTRVDSLDDELLCKMRLAGCQTISFGVESGSLEILKNIRKETTPEMVLEATRSAKKYGMSVRYYMIFIHRGETAETIQESIDLIKAGRPDSYMFGPLSFFPGTEDWAILSEKQGLTPDIFFKNDFGELCVATGRREELGDVLLNVECDIGAFYGFKYTVEEREAVVGLLPHLHSAHVELANAYFRAGRLDDAESALDRAEELGFPIGNIILNQRACIALARGEVNNALALLECACQSYPASIITINLESLRNWAGTPVNSRGKPPVLNDSIWAINFKSLMQSHNARPTAM